MYALSHIKNTNNPPASASVMLSLPPHYDRTAASRPPLRPDRYSERCAAVRTWDIAPRHCNGDGSDDDGSDDGSDDDDDDDDGACACGRSSCYDWLIKAGMYMWIYIVFIDNNEQVHIGIPDWCVNTRTHEVTYMYK